MIAHYLPLEELVHNLSTDVDAGLSDEQIEEQRSLLGENKLDEKEKKTDWQRFLDQFKDIMILILIIAAITSFIIALYHRESSGFFEPLLILLIVVLNAIMGMLQESKAEKALDALKSLSAPHARVLRNGKDQVVDASVLVPGDIIILAAGDFVPADARLISAASLKLDESALTGESLPSEKNCDALVEKNSPLGDRANMVFSGCSVTYGRAKAIVTSTGMNTELGKIASLLSGEEETQTPLQKKLANLGKYLGIMALAACLVIFIVGLIDGIPIMEIFMIAVSLAVSAIPEGLPAIVTVVLSIGVQRMVKHNAIIRRLPAVETLGSASVICSDKTGTLTQNRMTLIKLYLDGESQLEDVSEGNSDDARHLLKYATLCCDSSVVFSNDEIQHIGDPTETAIVLAAHNNGMPKDELDTLYPRLSELPFDSERKLMSTVNLIDGKNVVIVKGAFDMIVSKCLSGNLEKASVFNDSMSKDAIRVLALAYKEIAAVPENPAIDDLESNLIFAGLLGMIDPPRPEAKNAVAICRKAGIKPVMITGDYLGTASAIARNLDILQDGDDAITGQDLAAMSDDELDLRVRNISVYARVSPKDKIRIVKAWQKQGEVVSMTGDGVNDAPALKAADIGCAMGITGTDVAKGASDMILTDDNFATIVEAIKEGRGIYENIKKVVVFLLGTNIGEVLSVFFAMILWRQSPLISIQLLWINLVTDSMPAIALGMEAVEDDIMDRMPKPKNEGIFAHRLWLRVILQGFMFAILTLFGFWYGQETTGRFAVGQTMAFLILATSQIVQSFNMRSSHSLFTIGPFSSRNLNIAASISLALIALVVLTPLKTAFGLVDLSLSLYMTALGLSLLPIAVLEISKAHFFNQK
ncbi:MAG: calcium-translocating P-type ATPase, PMCA-type [Proteocatella sp.]